jgi:hypothetical protein
MRSGANGGGFSADEAGSADVPVFNGWPTLPPAPPLSGMCRFQFGFAAYFCTGGDLVILHMPERSLREGSSCCLPPERREFVPERRLSAQLKAA